ncbi:BlaI/MecI/CopY family transcriptional regulator [Sorangium sp. So ce1151]|uniref:BlaI/MecI/CopY family transcriptional regulator n=1 Tax=Sorangium sp. So ce1151 TaxID=3133332 RepID=UPI003F63CDDF
MGTGTLTDLQLAVMRALWEVGEGTASDVLSAMAKDGRALAPTTVATLLQRLSKQGWVEHRRHGRQLVYRALVSQKEAAKGVLHRVVSSFFGGRVSALTAQLLESEELSPEELEEMRRLLEEKGA